MLETQAEVPVYAYMLPRPPEVVDPQENNMHARTGTHTLLC